MTGGDMLIIVTLHCSKQASPGQQPCDSQADITLCWWAPGLCPAHLCPAGFCSQQPNRPIHPRHA